MIAIRAQEKREYEAYWRAGLITSAIVNQHRGRRGKAAEPDDFVPRRPRTTQPQPIEVMVARLRAITIALGGEVLTSGH